MHLVCLGVVHKLIVLWFRGPKEIKLGSKVRNELSERNLKIAKEEREFQLLGSPAQHLLNTHSPTGRPQHHREVEHVWRTQVLEYIQQMYRTLQNVAISEEQGRQLDAIQRRLCHEIPQANSKDVVERQFSDVEEFENFDAEIAVNATKKAQLLYQLSGIGRASIGAATRRILELLLSHEVAVQYSWAGQKGKKKFMALNTAEVIFRVVKQGFSEAKRSDVEAVIKVWLRHSGEKLRKKMSKTHSSSASTQPESKCL
ncbi:hypothetical protein MTO96_035414 [Rhipicephalus appendiculatus]